MTTKRPTAAQLDVLRKMADGWRLVERWSHFTHKRRVRCTPEAGRAVTVTLTTFDILVAAGWVEKDPLYCDDYRLIPAGLAASQQ